MHLQHLLVPLDFSPDAERALDYAVELAQQFQARLTLMHVVYMPPTTEVHLAAYLSEIEAGAEHDMQLYEKRVQDTGLALETILVRGVPFREIINLAEAQHVDLIVMGTHGRTGVKHLLLGSVAERVARLAPCPVLITRIPTS
ncbi:putative universal stress protein [Candidatus Entotheonellaceae bacterium PAL068K]